MKITVSLTSEKRSQADLLVVGVFEGERHAAKSLEALDSSAYQTINQAIHKKRFEGKCSESLPVYGTSSFSEAKDVLFVGLGKKNSFTAECLRKTMGGILCRAKAQKAKSVRILLDSFADGKVKFAEAARIVPEILPIADYKFDKYFKKDKDKPSPKVEDIVLIYGNKKDAKSAETALHHSEIVSRAVNFTRDLINEPANVMSPKVFAGKANDALCKAKVSVKVLGLDEIKRLKMAGVIAVSQGSAEPPRFVISEYGSAYKSKGTVCLVGKGVCFDSGGISIKPSKDMEKMKYDMSGAAAVTGTMLGIAELKPHVHVVGITPLVENMPSGTASRPGDIITYSNGKSVEIINTDAEGRLILADALIYASVHYKPKAVIDLATLTGACVVALADKCAGLMGNNSKFNERLLKVGEESGERLWELPMWPDYLELIKGHHSDLLNAGTGYGGTITAAKFLQEFVTCDSWAHLDIAGMAWADSNKAYYTKGGTGFGVRLLCNLLENWK